MCAYSARDRRQSREAAESGVQYPSIRHLPISLCFVDRRQDLHLHTQIPSSARHFFGAILARPKPSARQFARALTTHFLLQLKHIRSLCSDSTPWFCICPSTSSQYHQTAYGPGLRTLAYTSLAFSFQTGAQIPFTSLPPNKQQ